MSADRRRAARLVGPTGRERSRPWTKPKEPPRLSAALGKQERGRAALSDARRAAAAAGVTAHRAKLIRLRPLCPSLDVKLQQRENRLGVRQARLVAW